MDRCEIIYNAYQFIEMISKKYEIKFAYLFGSVARNTQNNESDVDIAIMFEKDYSDLEDAFIRGEIIESGKTFFKKDVDIVSLSKASLLLKYEVVKEGIILKDNYYKGDFESLVLREYFDFKYYSDIYNEKVIEKIKKGQYFKEV